MKKIGTPILTDWAVISVRWLFLIAASLWLAFGDGVDWAVLAIILLMAAGNIAATVFVVLNRASSVFWVICTIADFAFAHSVFFLTIATGRDLVWWPVFLPLISASLFFHLFGAIFCILANALLLGAVAFLFIPREDALLLVGILLPLNILAGMGLVYLGTRLNLGVQLPKRERRPPKKTIDHKELERRKTVYGLISELSATLNYQKVLETSLDLATTAMEELGAPVDRLVSAVMLFTGQDPSSPELNVATARRFLMQDKNLTLPGMRGAIAHVIETGNPVSTKDLKNDPELSLIISLHECRSAHVLPLRTGLDAYGVLLFAHHDPDFFTSDRSEVLEIVRNQSTIAIQNARLYQALEQEKNRMMEIQEESRTKLARDLHDGPTQSISAIAMRVNFARRLMDRDAKSASEELYKIEELARRTTKEIRHMLFTLRPLVLESQGLEAALESMADKMGETYSQEVIVQVDQRVVELLESSKQAVVFYIAEEAVNNARKHAEAGHVWVRLKLMRDGLGFLEIEDDGAGFDTHEVDATYESRGSLGMINLRERTELVNGILRIDSAKGRGTKVQVLIPLTEEAADRIRRGT